MDGADMVEAAMLTDDLKIERYKENELKITDLKEE